MSDETKPADAALLREIARNADCLGGWGDYGGLGITREERDRLRALADVLEVSETMVEAAARAMWPQGRTGDPLAFDACNEQVRRIYRDTARRGIVAALAHLGAPT